MGQAWCFRRSRGGSKDQNPRTHALGNPVELVPWPGQAGDLTRAEPSIENSGSATLIDDKASDVEALLEALAGRQINRVPPRDPACRVTLPSIAKPIWSSASSTNSSTFRAIAAHYDMPARNFLASAIVCSTEDRLENYLTDVAV